MPEEKKDAVQEFFKAVYDADGEVKVMPIEEAKEKDFVIAGVIEINDSEKGKIYIARVIPSK